MALRYIQRTHVQMMTKSRFLPSSGVPGPTEMLYYEPNVPLYMFGYQTNDYAILQKQVIR